MWLKRASWWAIIGLEVRRLGVRCLAFRRILVAGVWLRAAS